MFFIPNNFCKYIYISNQIQQTKKYPTLQMHPLKYPTLQQLTQKISMILKSQTNTQDILFQIKYAKLLYNKSKQYNTYLHQSKNSIIILNNQQNLNQKQYRINANATKQQYNMIQKNCNKIKLISKPQTIINLDLKFGRDKISYKLKNKKWYGSHKDQQLARQQNLLIGQKQFRMDINLIQKLREFGEHQVDEIVEKVAYVNCFRFKEMQYYQISPFYAVILSQIYQTEDEDNQYKPLFKKVVNKSAQDIQNFIVKNIPRNNKRPAKYQIQLHTTQLGIQHMVKLLKDPNELNLFFGDMLNNFRNICNPNFQQLIGVSQEWKKILSKKLQQQEIKIKIKQQNQKQQEKKVKATDKQQIKKLEQKMNKLKL